MNRSHTEIPERINKESIVRLISMFEVKRPKKSSFSSLRKSKSISSLSNAISSDDEETNFSEQKAPSKHHLPPDKIKRRAKSTRSTYEDDDCEQKINQIIADIEQTNKLVDDFGQKLKTRRLRQSIYQTENTEDSKTNTYSYSYHQSNKNFEITKRSTCTEEEDTESIKCVQSLDRRFYKNGTKKKYSSTYDTHCKELISRKKNKESREKTQESKPETEIESYRKNLVKEIDLALKNLKKDGFIDEDENNIQPISQDEEYFTFDGIVDEFKVDKTSTWAERVNKRRESSHLVENTSPAEPDSEDTSELLDSTSTICDNEVTIVQSTSEEEDKRESKISSIYGNLTDDEFGESLAEDLEENGSYFVEAYNDEGKELVIVEIAVERRAIDLSSLQAIAASIQNSDMVFCQNEDKSLNVIENAKDLVSTESISNESIANPESSRSTLYSTASRDSEIYDTDDEGISLGHGQKPEEGENYTNYRRETFCDNKGIVRIERVGYPEISVADDGSEPLSPVSRNNSFLQPGTLSYIIDEIKTTERKYVEDLHRVVTKYMPYIEEHTPPNLIGRQCYIFGNIDKLYNKQKEFLMALENCGETVDDVVKTFIEFERLFKLYPRYFKNKPKADIVLKEFNHIIKQSQTKFEERLDLSAYLLTPLQRLGKYKLFLENIEKQLKKLDMPIGSVQMALDIIKGEMSKGNDFVAIESIENSPINKEDYGSFKMREKFNVLKPRRFEAMVFLFENIIVFTICDPRNMDTYNYYTCIKMMDLRIATFEDLTIHLTDFTKSKRMSRADRFTYVLEAKTEKIRETWRKAIEAILWQQLFKVKENTLKMYQSAWGPKKNKTSRKLVKSTDCRPDTSKS